MAVTEQSIFKDTFNPLAEVLVPAEQRAAFMEQVAVMLHRQIGLRLIERYPTEQRQEILTKASSGQAEQMYELLANQIDAAQLQQIASEEVGELMGEIIQEAAPHMHSAQIFKLRHLLSQLG